MFALWACVSAEDTSGVLERKILEVHQAISSEVESICPLFIDNLVRPGDHDVLLPGGR